MIAARKLLQKMCEVSVAWNALELIMGKAEGREVATAWSALDLTVEV